MNKRFCRKFLAHASAVLMGATMVKPVGAADCVPVLQSETRLSSDGVDNYVYLSEFLSVGFKRLPGWSLKGKLEYFIEIAREHKYVYAQDHRVTLRWLQSNIDNRWRLFMTYTNGQFVEGECKKNEELKHVRVIVSSEEYAKLKLENASFNLINPDTAELPEEIQSFYETANSTEKKIILFRMLAIGTVFLAAAGSAYGLSKLMGGQSVNEGELEKKLNGVDEKKSNQSVSVIA